MTATQIQVGGGGKRGRMPSWKYVALVVGALLLAAVAGMGLRWWQQAREKAVLQSPGLSGLPKVVDDLQSLRDSGDEAAFNAALQKALNDSPIDSETRYMVYIQQGHSAMEKEEWQAAIEAYGKARAIQQDKQVAALLGDAYAALGDKAKATTYYEEAIRLVPEDHPAGDSLKDEYQNRIQMLSEEGQPL